MAKFVAPTRTCQLAKKQGANLHTDIWYALGVVLDFGMLWEKQKFLISAGTPIKNEQ